MPTIAQQNFLDALDIARDLRNSNHQRIDALLKFGQNHLGSLNELYRALKLPTFPTSDNAINEINDILPTIVVEDYDVRALLALLTALFQRQKQLSHYSALYQRIFEHLVSLQKDPHSHLHGLEPKNVDA